MVVDVGAPVLARAQEDAPEHTQPHARTLQITSGASTTRPGLVALGPLAASRNPLTRKFVDRPVRWGCDRRIFASHGEPTGLSIVTCVFVVGLGVCVIFNVPRPLPCHRSGS